MRTTMLTILAAVSGCYNTGDGLCVDWWDSGADCEPGAGGGTDASTTGAVAQPHPCDQIGAAVGLNLVSATYVDGDPGDTGAEPLAPGEYGSYLPWWDAGVSTTMEWSGGILSSWQWSGDTPPLMAKAYLAGYDGTLAASTISGHEPTWRWYLADGVVSASVDGSPAVVIQQPGGVAIVAYHLQPEPIEAWWYLAGASVKLRGYVTDHQGTLAGPAPSHSETTHAGGRAWYPATGICEIEGNGADVTGAGVGDGVGDGGGSSGGIEDGLTVGTTGSSGGSLDETG